MNDGIQQNALVCIKNTAMGTEMPPCHYLISQ